jgi:hypothetical protein
LEYLFFNSIQNPWLSQVKTSDLVVGDRRTLAAVNYFSQHRKDWQSSEMFKKWLVVSFLA